MSTAFEKNQTNSDGGRGGARAGAGRKKGSASKRTREIADAAAENGITPLEYMLQVMRQEPSPDLAPRDYVAAMMLRFEAAKAAAPYLHPRLTAVQHTGDGGGPIKMGVTLEVVGVPTQG